MDNVALCDYVPINQNISKCQGYDAHNFVKVNLVYSVGVLILLVGLYRLVVLTTGVRKNKVLL